MAAAAVQEKSDYTCAICTCDFRACSVTPEKDGRVCGHKNEKAGCDAYNLHETAFLPCMHGFHLDCLLTYIRGCGRGIRQNQLRCPFRCDVPLTLDYIGYYLSPMMHPNP